MKIMSLTVQCFVRVDEEDTAREQQMEALMVLQHKLEHEPESLMMKMEDINVKPR